MMPFKAAPTNRKPEWRSSCVSPPRKAESWTPGEARGELSCTDLSLEVHGFDELAALDLPEVGEDSDGVWVLEERPGWARLLVGRALPGENPRSSRGASAPAGLPGSLLSELALRSLHPRRCGVYPVRDGREEAALAR
jgi:hypothetical protein